LSKVIGRPPGEAAGLIVLDRRVGGDRRRFTLRTVLRGGLVPRRRTGRREGDVPLLLDWHQPHLVLMGLALLLLSLTDALMTLTLLSRGATEVNPMLAYLIEQHPQLFAAVKMALTGVGVVVLVVLARAKVFRVQASSILRWLVIFYLAVIVYELWLLGRIP
jgi:hypothetical protein